MPEPAYFLSTLDGGHDCFSLLRSGTAGIAQLALAFVKAILPRPCIFNNKCLHLLLESEKAEINDQIFGLHKRYMWRYVSSYHPNSRGVRQHSRKP